ncbi:MAG TPA: energy transducer TonB [Bacteroidia bacterium]|nr:energy transducer TonB [Bacteroidia bacterium]
MKPFLFSIGFIFILFSGFAQTSRPQKTDTTVYTFAEVMPDFRHGKGGFQKYLVKSVKYPEAEKNAGKQGTVYISFIVEKNGSISNVHAVKEVPGAPGFTKESIRVIQNMPRWSPAKVNGKPVRIEITQPIRFILDKAKK